MSDKKPIFERKDVPAGIVIIKEGDPGDCAYLIQAGEVTVSSSQGKKTIELAKLGAGEIFGEMALVSDAPRIATVRSTQETKLIVIRPMTLRRKMEQSDPTITALVQMLIKRLATNNMGLIEKQSSLSDLTENTNAIYQNVLSNLPKEHQKTFRDEVFSNLSDFLDSVEAFQEYLDKAKG